MLLRLLQSLHECCDGVRVYSVAIVARRGAEGTYEVRHEQAAARIQAREPLTPGKWVRFCGRMRSGVVVCDFAEALDGVDVHLLLRCIERLGRPSPASAPR